MEFFKANKIKKCAIFTVLVVSCLAMFGCKKENKKKEPEITPPVENVEPSDVPTTQTPEDQDPQPSTKKRTKDKFFDTEEGERLYQVANGFAEAYLNQNEAETIKYLAQDVTYDELADPYQSIEFVDLVLYSYDEETKEASMSYTILVNGEDSYTYLALETIYEGEDYKIVAYGLEK